MFFIRFSLRALQYRKQRLLLAFGALAVAAALATVLFGIYATVEQRIRDEFRAAMARTLWRSPVNGGTVPLAIVDAAETRGRAGCAVLVTQRPDRQSGAFPSPEFVAANAVLARAGQQRASARANASRAKCWHGS